MLNIIKRLDKIIDDLNCIDIEHTKNVDILKYIETIGGFMMFNQTILHGLLLNQMKPTLNHVIQNELN